MPSPAMAYAIAAPQQFNAGDWEGLAEPYRDESVMWPLENWPEPGPFVGSEAIVGEYKRLREAFQSNELTLRSVAERSPWVIARYSWIMKGASSGVPMETGFSMATRSDGAVARESYFH